MALKIYTAVDPNAYLSAEGTFTNPFIGSFNGITGEVQVTRLYLRNDDATKYYTGIDIIPVDGGENIVQGEGFSWRLTAGDTQPLEAQWILLACGNTIAMSDIGSVSDGDIRTYLPFWVRITVSRSAPIAAYQGVTFKIIATEGIVV